MNRLRVFLPAAWGSLSLLLLAPVSVWAQTASLSPTSVNFGDQAYGTPSLVQVVTLNNTHSTIDLVITSVTSDNPEFAVDASACTSASPLDPGGSCLVNITFTPVNLGSRTATLTADTDAPDVTASLSGNGIAGTFAPTVPAADASADAFTLNLVGADVTLTNGGAFTVTQPVLAITDIIIEGTSDDDVLTIDFAGGNFLPAGGLTYRGRGGTNSLSLTGGTFTSSQYVPIDGNSGTITLNDGSAREILYTELAPITDLTTTTTTTILASPSGETINIIDGGLISGTQTTQVNSGASATFELINFANKTNVTVDGFAGADNITINLPTVAAGLNALTVKGGSSSDTITLQANATGVTYAIEGNIGNDTIIFGTAGASLDGIVAPVTVAGNEGTNDTFTLFDSADADNVDYTLAATTADRTGMGQATFGTIENISITGSTGDNTFTITPNTDVTISIDGGDPTAAPGDQLDLDMTNVLGESHTITVADDQGSWSFTNRQTVSYDNIETQLDLADLTITQAVDFTQPFPGDIVTFTVTVANAGAAALTNGHARIALPSQVNFRTGTQALSNGSFAEATGTINWTNLALAASANTQLTFEVIANSELEGLYNSVASIISKDQADVNVADNTHTLGVDIQESLHFPAGYVVQAATYWTDAASNTHPIVGTYARGIFRGIPDGFVTGTRWADDPQNTLPAGLIVTDLLVTSANDLFATTWGNGSMYRSSDGGRTWSAVTFALGAGTIVYAIEQAADGTLYAPAHLGSIYKSSDNGATWTLAGALPNHSTNTPWSLETHPTNSQILYAGTFGFGTFVSTDGGENWTASADAGMGETHVHDLEFDPAVPARMYAATSQGVFYTEDGAASWTALQTGMGGVEVRSLAMTTNATGPLFAATWGSGVFVIPNRSIGTSWDTFALRTMQVHDLAIDPATLGILAVTESNGALVLTKDGAIVTNNEEEPSATLPATFQLEQNYPNPFNPRTTIQFALPEAVQARIAVYDALGREVAVLADAPFAPGQHTVQFDAANLPSGLYLYRLDAGSTRISRSMLLVK